LIACPACGHENENTGKFCSECGAKLTAQAAPSRQVRIERAAIVDFLSSVPADGHLDQICLIPVRSNRQPALAAFIAESTGEGHQFYGLMVFAIEENEISAFTGFADPGLSDYLGLPAWLAPDRE
jgi:predicted amidophosphoribosyltransferase